MVPVVIIAHTLHLAGTAAAVAVAKKLIDPVIDYMVEVADEITGEQILRRSIEFANRKFHLEKHPSLTLLTHFLSEENMAAAEKIDTAKRDGHSLRTLQIGSLKVTTWNEKKKDQVVAKIPVSKLPFIERKIPQNIDVYG